MTHFESYACISLIVHPPFGIPGSAPVLLIPKKMERSESAVILVSINPFLHPQVYPLTTSEEMFSTLANGESYTKLNLARAYKQMKVRKECRPLLTINTHCGLFQYTRLPFGITSAPSLWQRAMAQVLSGLSGVVCYIDDILVTRHTKEQSMPITYMQYFREWESMASDLRSPSINFSQKN